MADTHGQTPDPLIAELVKRPYAFDFFHAVRLLESRRPELPRVGFSYSPSEDPVRFWQNPSLRFPPSTIESVRAGTAAEVPRMAVHFFGLFGTHGPLPPHLTEYVLERELHHHDHTITAFFNIFHHRLVTLFYRAWAASQKAVDLDRPAGQRYANYVGSMFGIGMDALRERDAVPDAAKLFFAGRLANQTRNKEGLEAILREYFHIPVEVEPFTGRWLNLPGDSLCQLGCSELSSSLGVNAIAGERFWDCQLSFRMKFGPMNLADYVRMLPPDPGQSAGGASADHAALGATGGADATGDGDFAGGADSTAPGDQAADPSLAGAGYASSGRTNAGAGGDARGATHGGSFGTVGLSEDAGRSGGEHWSDAGRLSGERATVGDAGQAGQSGDSTSGAAGFGSGTGGAGGAGGFGFPGGSEATGAGGPPSDVGLGASASQATIRGQAGDPQLANFFRAQAEAAGSGSRLASSAGAARGAGGDHDRGRAASGGVPGRGGGAVPASPPRRGESFERVKYWVKNYCGEHFAWDAQLVLRAEEVPETCLGRAGWLGYTSWLKTKPFSSDADELILNPPPD